MKVKKLKPGSKIDVGDYLLKDTWMGKEWLKFVRVTDKHAMVRWSDKKEGKFQREIKEVGIRPCGDHDPWAAVEYSAWRPIGSVSEVVVSEDIKNGGNE